LESKKALIIDDDAHIRRVVELKLKNRGFKVITAKNGEEGLNIILNQPLDVVISDINMPKMDGETLCRKTDDLKKERPFLTIIITSRLAADKERWIDEMRDTLFMEKPFSPTKLVEVIDSYFMDH